MKKVLVTGANGFIGKHLCLALSRLGYEVFKIDLDSFSELNSASKQADIVIHLAGINRVKDDKDYEGNIIITSQLIAELTKGNKKCPIIYSSSRKVLEDSPYGRSKLEAEAILEKYAETNNTPLYIYRLDNVFGPAARPNYNSAIATFCYNLNRNLPIKVNDPETELTLVYIDDLVNEIVRCINESNENDGIKFLEVSPKEKIKLGALVKLLYQFKESRESLLIPDLSNGLIRKLNATYISYLPDEDLTYPLVTHADNRGFFSEIFRTFNIGQISLNMIKIGQKKGNHWHFRKFEKFIVVKGNVKMTFQRVGEDKETVYNLTGDKLEVIDIPPLISHTIENTGEEDALVLMWVSEVYDENNADTYRED